jgi:cell volume regulation protein A
LLVVSGGLTLFAAINAAGGSGFLAIYLAGLMIANRPTHATEHVLRVMDGLAWLAQAGMFLVLGLLVTPSRLLDDLGDATIVAVALILIVRPIAVAAGLLPFRFPWREVGFISWVGLRGAVPIVLSVFPVMAGLEGSTLLFNVTFVVVLMSLIVQGTTIPNLARLFGVEVPHAETQIDRLEVPLPGPANVELVQLTVERGASCFRREPVAFIREKYPANGTCVALVRNEELVFPGPQTVFEAGDIAILLLPHGAHEKIAPLFARLPDVGPLSARSFFGEFVLDGGARVADVMTLYGGSKPARAEENLTIAELLDARLGRGLVVGDRLQLDRIAITVREIEDGKVVRVGLKLADSDDT